MKVIIVGIPVFRIFTMVIVMEIICTFGWWSSGAMVNQTLPNLLLYTDKIPKSKSPRVPFQKMPKIPAVVTAV